MWRLKHKLFGWHYAHLENTCDQIVRRVHWTAGNRPYVVYFSHHHVYLDEPNGWKVTSLTHRDVESVSIRVIG